ncbi:MAG: hypothetical protein J6R32_03135, partial [Bacteroidales bacterium]|nr:hypothetical protein [Bacteroidales bacterium]
FLEECLFSTGRAIFIKDPQMSYMNLKATPAATLNPYNEPTAYTAYSVGYSKVFNSDDCVYIRNNYLEKSTDSNIMIFAERLTNIEMSHGVNINAQKTPVLILCDDKSKLSLETVYNQYAGDSPVIFGTKSLTDNPLSAITTGAPFVADKLREEKHAVWNECLEFLGINTNPADKKKERLIVSEVNSNNEQIDIQALTMLLCRQQACEAINKKYGLNVSVSLRVDELKPEPEPVEDLEV